jgi:hypothetical protein
MSQAGQEGWHPTFCRPSADGARLSVPLSGTTRCPFL